jgi:hypothetical protein
MIQFCFEIYIYSVSSDENTFGKYRKYRMGFKPTGISKVVRAVGTHQQHR